MFLPALSRRRRWSVLPSCTLLLTAVLLSSTLRAQTRDIGNDPYGPARARGGSGVAEGAQIDSVNRFNGSLQLAVPIGQRYPAGGLLSYQLVAHYNSNLQDVRLRRGPQPEYPEVSDYQVTLPNAGSTAGLGWSLHLGRLFEPTTETQYNAQTAEWRERRPRPGFVDGNTHFPSSGWRYLAADDAVTDFHTTLRDGDYVEPHVLHARNGTFVRLQLKDPGTNDPLLGSCPDTDGITRCAFLELPGGEVHRFERRPSWPDAQYNKDDWRLRQIRDRGNGNGQWNAIDISYFPHHWEVTDHFQRKQKIHWEPDPAVGTATGWYYGRVRAVELTTFANTTSTWQFKYQSRGFQRIADNGHSWQQRSVSVLEEITRPDQRRYVVLPPADHYSSPIQAATTPSGARLEWQYTQYSLPSVAQCGNGASSTGGGLQNFVKYRAVRDTTGATLSEAWYLWGQYPGTTLPAPTSTTGYCLNDVFWITPAAEHVGGVFQRYRDGGSRLTLHYYSVWPFPAYVTEDGYGGKVWSPAMAGNWGWQGEDFGQPFTRNQSDGNGAFLSSQVYDCPLDSPGAINKLPDPKSLAQACSKLRSHYVKREGVRRYPNRCGSVGCTPYFIAAMNLEPESAGLAQTRKELGVFHQSSGDIRTEDEYSDNDGFGHYRLLTTSGTIGPDQSRRHYQDFNSDRGVLLLDAHGAPASGSTWSNYRSDRAWVLGNVARTTLSEQQGNGSWKMVGDQVSCHLANSPLLKRQRVRKSPGADSREDLATTFAYNYALPGTSRHYGGDLTPLPAASVGLGCNYAFENSTPPVQIDHTYAHGVLLTSRQSGSSVYLIDHRNRSGAAGIDANTSLVTADRDESGTVLTESTFDTLGRLLTVTRIGSTDGLVFDRPEVGPDETYTHFLPGDAVPAGWSGPTHSPLLLVRSHKSGQTLQQTATVYDVLGRDVRQEILHPESGVLRIERRYGADGGLVFETTPQLTSGFSSSRGTATSYDLFGRPLTVTAADGLVTTFVYTGIQQVDETRAIGVIDGSGGVTHRNATTTTRFDRYGNVLLRSEPMQTAAPLAVNARCGDGLTTCKHTQYRYDAANREVAAIRGLQTRLHGYDGRGFLTYERLPELGGGNTPCVAAGAGCRLYGEYNTRGNAGRRSDGHNTLAYVHDSFGRLERITDGAQPATTLLNNRYGNSGLNNGRLVSAERHNWVTRENSGGAGEFAGAPSIYGNRRVRYDYTYHVSGQAQSRQTQVHYVPPVGSEFLMAQFDQSWGFDAVGRITSIQYPLCTRPGCNSTGTSRQVTLGLGFGGRLRSVTTANNLGANLSYHPNGQLQRISHHGTNGRHDWFGMGPNHLPRTSAINLASTSTSNPAQAGYLDLGSYRYDGAGNITQVGATRFLYDLDSRLTRSTIGGFWGAIQDFAYDEYDNLTAATPDTFNVDASTNRLLAPDLSYDGSGQVIRVGNFAMHYDAGGQQEAMVLNSQNVANPCVLNNVTGSCWLYWYGPDGERIGGISLLPNGQGNYFWTLRDHDGRVLRRFDGINESISPREDLVYAGRLLIGSRNFTENAVRHHHSDHLGTVRLSTDALSGSWLGQRSFSPYGRSTGAPDGTGLLTPGWAAYELDPNKLTHHLGAREYLSTWGRFFTPDPANDGWNLYAYARNNPVTHIDPFGLEATSAGQCKDQGQEGNSGGAQSNGTTCAATTQLTAQQKANRAQANAVLGTVEGRAFLDMIQAAEGHDFNTVYGGVTFDSFERHPGRIGKKRGGVRQSAAGAYAFTLESWNDVGVRQLGLTDFSPESQRMAAALLLAQKGRFARLQAGNFWGAVNASSGRWASLPANAPGSDESIRFRYSGQGHHGWDFFQSRYDDALQKHTAVVRARQQALIDRYMRYVP